MAAPDDPDVTAELLEQTLAILEDRVDATVLTEPITRSASPDHVEVAIAVEP